MSFFNQDTLDAPLSLTTLHIDFSLTTVSPDFPFLRVFIVEKLSLQIPSLPLLKCI